MPFSTKTLPDNPEALELWIDRQEKDAPKIKEGARASIIWADPREKTKTEYAMVYLHGFKASHGEGHPVHREVAKNFGCNLYLSRLEGHGLDIKKPLKDISASSFEESAFQALAIGKKIGKKVIIMGTSTGGSMGLFLAARPELSTHLSALILYSPLIEFYGVSQWLLGNTCSRTILKGIPGKNYMLTSKLGSLEAEKQIWYHTYALQGALALGAFIQKTMTSSAFSKIKCPVFVGYYYKNDKEQDKVVSIAAIKKMFGTLGTKEPEKILKNFPEARTHVISSGLVSESVERIKKETEQFISGVLGYNQS